MHSLDPFNFTIPIYIQLFVLFSCLVLFLFVRNRLMVKAGDKERLLINRLAVGLVLFYSVVLLLADSRVFIHYELPPRILVLFVFLFAGMFFLFRSQTLRQLLLKIPSENVVLFQTWRFLPELLILFLISEGLLSELMTVTGLNYDLFAPVTAPVVYLLLRKSPSPARIKIGIWWNASAMAVLAFTIGNAILAMPWPFQQHFVTPPNTAVAYFPVILLPAFMVPLAFTGHILAIIGLRRRLKTTSAEPVTVPA